ncbi:hypothetical protein TNCV_4134461 [Trichonephila clavipes]|nr:hypothetical protein TNCV_4134461 [Trichonephila clavipes]
MPQKLMLDDKFPEPPQSSTSSSYLSFQHMSEANCMQLVYAVVHSLISRDSVERYFLEVTVLGTFLSVIETAEYRDFEKTTMNNLSAKSEMMWVHIISGFVLLGAIVITIRMIDSNLKLFYKSEWAGMEMLLLFQMPLEQKSLYEVHLTFPRKNVTNQVLHLQTNVPGKCPSSPKDEQKKQGESRDR